MSDINRSNGRKPDQLRPVLFESQFTKYAEGSVLARFGDTQVLCNATLDDNLPRWLRNSRKPHGWLTAEYAMLPRSTQTRIQREKRWPKGRTQEISRLIGRSLRMSLDLTLLGMRQVIIDCDVLQADGGTRTAAITGAWLALNLALQPLIDLGQIPQEVLRQQIAAVSVGIVNGHTLLDLEYIEDVNADVDLNVIMTAKGEIVEIQGTAEKAPFSRMQFDRLLDLASLGIRQLIETQEQLLQKIHS